MDHRDIVVRGAHENNLKHVNIRIPHGKLVVVTGLSGSGKSSLVFSTIAVEAMRQLQDIFPMYVRSRMPHYEMPRAELINNLTTAVVIEQRQPGSDIRSTVATMTDIAPMLRLLFSRCAEPFVGDSSMYSPNDPRGMCPECSGLGKTVEFNFDQMFDMEKSLNEGAILFPGHQVGTYQWQIYANSGRFDLDKKLKDYTPEEWEDFMHGSGQYVKIINGSGGPWEEYALKFEGVADRLTRLYLKRDLTTLNKTAKKVIEEYTHEGLCPCCHGAKLNETILNSRLCGLNIAEVGDMEISDLPQWLDSITHPNGIAVAKKIKKAVESIEDLGLGYLNLNRPSVSLSGGEIQRLKMVRYLGSSLVGITYIFDEPSAGLHQRDIERLCRLLIRLRDRGNTVLVVEHDKTFIRLADQVIEMGPKAGRHGGEVVFQGSYEELLQTDTHTSRYLQRQIPFKENPRQAKDFIEIRNASLHNLKDVSVKIPQKVFTAVSGMAGAGKSSLICGELLKQYPKAIHISQGSIGKTSRSNPATYIGIMDPIRKMFAAANGVGAGMFSFSSEGACPVCGGKGEIKTEMAFLDPVTRPCEACGGSRYSQEALSYTLKGKNILQVLEMTIQEAYEFFEEPAIRRKLATLIKVGMGYMTLGQPTTTLSGGECQRIKLASHLNGKNGVYILDEPTTGLHGEDVTLLLGLLNDMVDAGNTVIVIEHNLDVIRQADWVIDMGPEGGKCGGQVLYEGVPSGLLQCEASQTGRCLRAEA